MPKYVAVDHPRFRRAERAIFTSRIVADCMTHACRDRDPDRAHLDACCQYGADTDLRERDRILAHADQLRALLAPRAAGAAWFGDEVEHDPDFPSGAAVRTATLDGGCIFLAHDARGCAIHRAALEGGWDFRGVKPHVCRLFPLSYDDQGIVLSDDYPDYSCAYTADAPTLYRHGRDLLAELFGADLVRALDAAERVVLAAAPVRLPVVAP